MRRVDRRAIALPDRSIDQSADTASYRGALSHLTRPSRPIGATCGSSNECVTDRPTDTASYRGALSHLKTATAMTAPITTTTKNVFIFLVPYTVARRVPVPEARISMG